MLWEQGASASGTAAEASGGPRDVVGVVLAGGLSRRMGREKARLHVHGPGQPDILVRTCALLGEVCAGVWVSCRRDRPHADQECVFDVVEGLGPLGGVHAALLRAREAGYAAVLALSCDLPFMDRPTLERLLHARRLRPDALLTTYRQRETGFIQALAAVYETAALPLFETALQQGLRQLNGVVPEARWTCIPFTHAEARPFFNVNYPAELERARAMMLQQPE